MYGRHEESCLAYSPLLDQHIVQNPESEAARKAKEIEELRAQERFMKVGTGEADCLSCGYKYEPSKGDPEFPVAPGTKFQVSFDRMCLC